MAPPHVQTHKHNVIHIHIHTCTNTIQYYTSLVYNSSRSTHHQMPTDLTSSCLLGSAPLSSSSCTVSWWPLSLAIWRAVCWPCDRYQNREPSVLTHMYVSNMYCTWCIPLTLPSNTHHTHPPYSLHVHQLHGPVALSQLQSDLHDWPSGGQSDPVAVRETGLVLTKSVKLLAQWKVPTELYPLTSP